MKYLLLILLTGITLSASVVHAESRLDAKVNLESIQTRVSLGNINSINFGLLKFFARRNNEDIVIQVETESGKVLGKAETTLGVTQTPIYFKTSEGLEKVIIYWRK